VLDELLILVYQRLARRPTDSVAQAVDALMADEIKALTPEEAVLREIEVLERLAVLYRARAAGRNISALKEEIQPATSDAVLIRLPLEEAIIAVLRRIKDPQKPSQVCRALIRAGYDFVSGNPSIAVKTAFNSLAPRNDDLVYVGSGKWTLASVHTAAKLKKLKDKYAGRGGHSTEEHARATREGMIAKGLKFGRKPKFGPDDIAKFRQLVDNKIKRPIAALKEVGISTPYYYAYKKEIYAWKPGDPWPPAGGFPRGTSGDELRQRGVIPFQARTAGEES